MFVNKHFPYLNYALSQKVKGVIMRMLRGTIFNMKANVLQDFYICISVPLREARVPCHKNTKNSSWQYMLSTRHRV